MTFYNNKLRLKKFIKKEHDTVKLFVSSKYVDLILISMVKTYLHYLCWLVGWGFFYRKEHVKIPYLL